MAKKLLVLSLILIVGGLTAWAVIVQSRPVGTVNKPIRLAETPAESPLSAGLPLRYEPTGVVGGEKAFERTLAGLTVDRNFRLYAAGDSEVKVFDHCAKLVKRFPIGKPPLSIAVDEAGTVYVGQAGQVERFDADGKPLGQFAPGQITGNVTALAATKDELLVGLADKEKQRGRIARFDRSGKLLGTIGAEGPAGGLVIPNGTLDFALDAQGRVLAANPGRHLVETFDPSGKPLTSWGKYDERDPSGLCGCCNPMNLAVTPDGHVITAEKTIARVKVYDAAGKLLAYIGPEHFDQSNWQMDLAVDPDGRIYVADTNARVIRQFTLRK